MILAWKGPELLHGQACDWHTDWQTHGHTDTHRCRQRQYPMAKTGLGYKCKEFFRCVLICCIHIKHNHPIWSYFMLQNTFPPIKRKQPYLKSTRLISQIGKPLGCQHGWHNIISNTHQLISLQWVLGNNQAQSLAWFIEEYVVICLEWCFVTRGISGTRSHKTNSKYCPLTLILITQLDCGIQT